MTGVVRERYKDPRGIWRWRTTPTEPTTTPTPLVVEREVHHPAPRAPMRGPNRDQVDAAPVLAVLDAWYVTCAPWKDLADLTDLTTNYLHGIRIKRPKTIRTDISVKILSADVASYEPPQRKPWNKKETIVQGIRDGMTLDEAAENAGTTRASALDAARKRLRICPEDPGSNLIMDTARSNPAKLGRKPR